GGQLRAVLVGGVLLLAGEVEERVVADFAGGVERVLRALRGLLGEQLAEVEDEVLALLLGPLGVDVAERDVRGLVPEDVGELVAVVERAQETLVDEDVAAGRRERVDLVAADHEELL